MRISATLDDTPTPAYGRFYLLFFRVEYAVFLHDSSPQPTPKPRNEENTVDYLIENNNRDIKNLVFITNH
jgi:hypothetical protein